MAINWAPLCGVPMHRRLEVLSMGFLPFLIFGIPLMFLAFLIYSLIAGNIYCRIISAMYVLYYIISIRSAEHGGWGAGNAWVRGWSLWKYCIDYFPIDLVKTTDLTPDRNYLVCIFPHGALSFGAAFNFATNRSKWSTLFPGIRSKLTTLPANYYAPIVRDLYLLCGTASASANSLTTMLSQSNDPNDKSNRDGYTSTAVGLIAGGVREQQYIYPDAYKFVVAKRRGFGRIALKTGATLVPAISFGENNVFRFVDYDSTSLGRRIRAWYECRGKEVPRLFCGRGYFQYDYGLIPNRHPITTVIGAPIHLEKNPEPSAEDLDKVHELFCMKISELFEEHKSKYVENSEDIHLEFL